MNPSVYRSKEEIAESCSRIPLVPAETGIPLTAYAALAETVVLTDGTQVTVWDRAIRQAFQEHDSVFIPAASEPYYIFRSIVLRSGQQIHAAADAVIKAVPGMITAMVRNASIVPGNQLPEPGNVPPDRDILVSGGIWDYSCTSYTHAGRANVEDGITGANGTFLFSNVRRLTICNLELRACGVFCIQVSNTEDLRVADVIFRDSFADGLHLNGPLRNVMAERLTSEGTGDDIIALNAWDWTHSHVTAGPIENVCIRSVICRKGYSCIRILPSIQHYYDGTARDCCLRDLVFQDVRNVQNFKIYVQSEPSQNGAAEVGHLENLYFDGISGLTKKNRLSYDPPYYGQGDQAASFEILANAENVVFDHLSGDFDFADDPAVIAVGPLAYTGNCGGKDKFFALDFFPANCSCTVRNLSLGRVTGKDGSIPPDRSKLVKVFRLSVKKDFDAAKESYRGGTGSGAVEGLAFPD